MKILSGWYPINPDGTENFIEADSLERIVEALEEFRQGIEKDSKVKWDWYQACEIMRINPEWFVDERSIELIEIYLFHRQNPALAFPGSFAGQPAIWLNAKIMLDSLIGPQGLM